MAGWFDANLYVPRALYRKYVEIAEEVSLLTKRTVDENDIVTAVLIDFVKNNYDGVTRHVARNMLGLVADDAGTRREREQQYMVHDFRTKLR